jgi:hypothetical protein
MKIIAPDKDIINLLSLILPDNIFGVIEKSFKIDDGKARIDTVFATFSCTIEADKGCLVVDISNISLLVVGGLFGTLRKKAGKLIIQHINKLNLPIKAKKKHGNIYINIDGVDVKTAGFANDTVLLDLEIN